MSEFCQLILCDNTEMRMCLQIIHLAADQGQKKMKEYSFHLLKTPRKPS